MENILPGNSQTSFDASARHLALSQYENPLKLKQMEPNQQLSSIDAPQETKPPNKPPISAHFLCGWPLLLVAIGGAIGGGLGGAAYGVNMKIYKSKLPVAAKVLFNILTGISAIGIWTAIAAAIQSARK